jgi:phage gpG-like protein
MADEDETTFSTVGLDKLIRLFGQSMPTVRVGILGNKSAREGKAGVTNAEVGAFHEFGTSKLPQRSFLRMPLALKLDKQMKQSGAFDKDVLQDAIHTASFVPYMKKIAVLCESIVLGAFETGGYGQWRPSNMNRKKNWQTLVETQQLRNSITSEVKEGTG